MEYSLIEGINKTLSCVQQKTQTFKKEIYTDITHTHYDSMNNNA